MTEKMKTTAPISSVGADGAQPQLKKHNEIIANETTQINLQAENIPEKSGVGGDRYSYSSDYEIVTKLKSFSDKYGICLLVVHHTRKLESEDSFDMISGTNGLLGAADGAFIMHKKKRTDNEAVMDIVGRDQPDQELTIEFDRERCVWKFKKAETELWKQPPNPLLEAINNFLTEDKPEWEGTATELVSQLPDMQIQANVLSRKLNVVNSQLLNDYGIFYDNRRGYERKITLKRLEPRE